MTVQTLTITYQVPAGSVVDDPLWLRLEQELLAEDIATVADAAAVLDALYELEPCEDRPDNEESGSLTNPPQEDEEPTTADLATAAQTIDYLGCDIEPDGSVAVVVRIIRADPTRPYVLRITGGRVVPAAFGQAAVPVTVQEEHQQHLLVEAADSVVLDYPVVSGFSAQWLGPVIGDGPIAKPTINRTGTTLHWDGTVTGTIAVRYLTTYDRATVLVYGVDGKPGEATIRCFCHGLVEELVPELPEPAEIDRSLCLSRSWDLDMEPDEVVCVEDITVYTVCECSKRELKAYTYQQEVACPDWAPINCPNNETRCTHLLGSRAVYEYVPCTDDNEVEGRPGYVYSVSQPDYYEDVCCRKPDKPLPRCPEKTISYKGGQPIELGEAHYRTLYGPTTRIQPVAPPGGICGEWTIRQVISSSNCCEGVEPLAWDTAVSPEVMSPNSAVIIGVTGGGRYALTWTVSGHGFQFQNGSTRIVTGPIQNRIRLSALPSACGYAEITVSDGCSTVTAGIRCTLGRWVLLGSFRPPVVYDQVANGFIAVGVNGYSYQRT